MTENAPEPGQPASPRRRRTAFAVALSLVAHAGVLGWLSVRLVAVPFPSRPDTREFQVELPRQTPKDRLRVRSVAPSRATASLQAERVQRPAAKADAIEPKLKAQPATAAALPTIKSPSPAPAMSSTSPAPTGAGEAAGLAAADERGALRSALGCAHAELLHLSPFERAACAEKLGLALRTAPRIDPIPAEKRAYYDRVAAAYAQGRAPPGNVPTGFAGVPRAGLLADKGGPYIPLPMCAMRFGAPRGWRSYRAYPPHSLRLGKLGALSCFIAPPSGRGFEESGVEDPASLRERTDDAAHMKALDSPKP